MNIKCKKCGFENPMGAIFCRQCGEKVEINDVSPDQLDRENQAKARKEKIKSTIMKLIGCLFILLIIGVVASMFVPYGLPPYEPLLNVEEADEEDIEKMTEMVQETHSKLEDFFQGKASGSDYVFSGSLYNLENEGNTWMPEKISFSIQELNILFETRWIEHEEGADASADGSTDKVENVSAAKKENASAAKKGTEEDPDLAKLEEKRKKNTGKIRAAKKLASVFAGLKKKDSQNNVQSDTQPIPEKKKETARHGVFSVDHIVVSPDESGESLRFYVYARLFRKIPVFAEVHGMPCPGDGYIPLQFHVKKMKIGHFPLPFAERYAGSIVTSFMDHPEMTKLFGKSSEIKLDDGKLVLKFVKPKEKENTVSSSDSKPAAVKKTSGKKTSGKKKKKGMTEAR